LVPYGRLQGIAPEVPEGQQMANTPTTALRIPPELTDAARAAVGNLPVSVLVRAGLAVLAGEKPAEALKSAQTRPGPKSRRGAAA
jgi:hypothetical protein